MCASVIRSDPISSDPISSDQLKAMDLSIYLSIYLGGVVFAGVVGPHSSQITVLERFNDNSCIQHTNYDIPLNSCRLLIRGV